MKSIVAILALITLTGCAGLQKAIDEGNAWVYSNPVGRNPIQSTVVTTPSGTYVVRSNTSTSVPTIQVYRSGR